ncbi:hypothetical protein DSO57_1038371 [Entomophthora muscae]|uniref:Uncharacterized protein n=1 Tax=Entomophthora muscae TaxID=34485 RepID=A0ACC2T9D1_9FUNG|nr:hypothetical protein DSO57_1038371 [Entomophthora muscae]
MPTLSTSEPALQERRASPVNSSPKQESQHFGRESNNSYQQNASQPPRGASMNGRNEFQKEANDHSVSQMSSECDVGLRHQAARPNKRTNRPEMHAPPTSTAPKSNGASKDTCVLDWHNYPANVDMSFILDFFSEAKGPAGIHVKPQGISLRLTFGSCDMARCAYIIFQKSNLPGRLLPFFEDPQMDSAHKSERSPSQSSLKGSAIGHSSSSRGVSTSGDFDRQPSNNHHPESSGPDSLPGKVREDARQSLQGSCWNPPADSKNSNNGWEGAANNNRSESRGRREGSRGNPNSNWDAPVNMSDSYGRSESSYSKPIPNRDAPVADSKPVASGWDAPIMDSKPAASTWDAPGVEPKQPSIRDASTSDNRTESRGRQEGSHNKPNSNWDTPVVDSKPASSGWDAPVVDSKPAAPAWDAPVVEPKQPSIRDVPTDNGRSVSRGRQERSHSKPNSSWNAPVADSKPVASGWDAPIMDSKPAASTWDAPVVEPKQPSIRDAPTDNGRSVSRGRQERSHRKPISNWDTPVADSKPVASGWDAPIADSKPAASTWNAPVVEPKQPSNSRSESHGRRDGFHSKPISSQDSSISDAKPISGHQHASAYSSTNENAYGACLKLVNYPHHGRMSDLLKKICPQSEELLGLAILTPTILYLKFCSPAQAQNASERYSAAAPQAISLIADPPRYVHFIAHSQIADVDEQSSQARSDSFHSTSDTETTDQQSLPSSPDCPRAHVRVKPPTDNGPARRMIAHALGRRLPRS